MPAPWWQHSVIYQIYPHTFADGNGDGTGDLRGIINRLDYLNDGDPESDRSLGVDAIWLSPINRSPMVDGGYDVSDYRNIYPTFGTLADFDELLSEAHRRNIRVILDLVVNHTSDEHPWFAESASSRDNPKADWYLWQDPKEDDGDGRTPPNNWCSYLNGSGWTYCEQRQQMYFHTFNRNQPDLNWGNPEVRAAIHAIVRFWLDRGVDGFRLDASSVYSKDPDYHDNPFKYGCSDPDAYDSYHHLYDRNLPENHQIIREIREIVDSYGDRLLIGETFIDNRLYDSAVFYGTDNDELHLPLTFEFPFSPWYPGYLQRQIEKKEKLTPPGAWPAYFLDNHDIPRHLSRWIECSLCIDSRVIAKAAATLLLTVRGTPILYYGQELGMENHEDIPPERLQDRATFDSDIPPRDGARTPMQWDESPHAGFSFGQDVQPWLPVHPNYSDLNVAAAQQDPDSIWRFYQQLLKVRRHSRALRQGHWRSLIHFPHEQLVYVREVEEETVLVVINFSFEKPLATDVAINPEAWTVLISTEYAAGKVMDIPASLESFEVTIYQRQS